MMAIKSSVVNRIMAYFEHPTLTTIHSELRYELLRKMKNKLMCHVASVLSYLGGGANGHLGLLLTPK